MGSDVCGEVGVCCIVVRMVADIEGVEGRECAVLCSRGPRFCPCWLASAELTYIITQHTSALPTITRLSGGLVLALSAPRAIGQGARAELCAA